jgi:hypothetical protein
MENLVKLCDWHIKITKLEGWSMYAPEKCFKCKGRNIQCGYYEFEGLNTKELYQDGRRRD